MRPFDVAIIGAGAAGMFCAALAGQRGLRVVLIDHATHIGEKIRISGGGRCNFTNTGTGPANFLSRNPHFCRSALARYTPQDFIALLKKHRIAFHEKHRGQLFCDKSAEDIIAMLRAECEAGQVAWRTGCAVEGIRQEAGRYAIDTEAAGTLIAGKLVIATGGLSIPKIGATDFGYRIARQFGHTIVEPRPALVPLTFGAADWAPFRELAGVSLEAAIATGSAKSTYGPGQFHEDLLFTHKGLSGPAVLQASSYWQPGAALALDLYPAADISETLIQAKRGAAVSLATALANLVPKRLAQAICESEPGAMRQGASVALADCPDRLLSAIGARINRLSITPDGTEGFRKAEVTIGGVDTRQLSSQTMESQKSPGLYFIGEVVDVTGWLGGYNFQWAWASAAACAGAL